MTHIFLVIKNIEFFKSFFQIVISRERLDESAPDLQTIVCVI